MKFRTMLFLGCLSALASAATICRAAELPRFSSTLSPADSGQTGLTRLSSDQIAVLDALVRHDRTLTAALGPTDSRAPLFSQRLSADERRNAGLTLLSDGELAQLDATVERFTRPAALAATAESNRTTTLNSVRLRRDPEIHGSVTLIVGAGSDGYSEYGGALNLTYFDPARRFAIEVGYSEMHYSGRNLDRCFYRR